MRLLNEYIVEPEDDPGNKIGIQLTVYGIPQKPLTFFRQIFGWNQEEDHYGLRIKLEGLENNRVSIKIFDKDLKAPSEEELNLGLPEFKEVDLPAFVDTETMQAIVNRNK